MYSGLKWPIKLSFPRKNLPILKINENQATGKAGKKKISFIREGGRWYLTAGIMD